MSHVVFVAHLEGENNMIKRIIEASLPKSQLSELCKPFVQGTLGVYPFPSGEDSVILKATYFNFNPAIMDIVTGEDVKITVDEDSITVFINRNCNPNGGWDKVLEEPITPENPFAVAMKKVVEFLVEETQKNGKDWCRIGNYKTLQIKSPYVDRLKAFCILNPDVRIPGVAVSQIRDMKDTPEVEKTLAELKGEVIPEDKVQKINQSQPEGVKPNIRRIVKPLTDKQRQNRVNKLLSLGIGGEKDKSKTTNPRVIKRK